MNNLEMKEHSSSCKWNLFNLFHFHNRHHNIKRLLDQVKSTKGAKSSKSKGRRKTLKKSGCQSPNEINEALNVDLLVRNTSEVPHQLEDESKESTTSDTSYSSRLIRILDAEKTPEGSFGESPLTNASAPAYFGLAYDGEAGETSIRYLESDGVSPTFSIHLSRDVDNFSGSALGLSPRYLNKSECGYDVNTNTYTGHAQVDDLELFVKHVVLRERLDEAKKAILDRNYRDVKELARHLVLNSSKDFPDALEVHDDTNKELLSTFLENPSEDFLKHEQESQHFKVETEVPYSSSCVDSSQIHENDIKHKSPRNKFLEDGGEPKDVDSQSKTLPCKQKRKECTKVKKTLHPTGMNRDIIAPGTPENEGVLNHALHSQEKQKIRAESGKVIARLKDIKRRLKHALKEGKKVHKHVSMDGILHKIPYGSKITRKDAKDNKGENALHRKNEGYGGDNRKNEGYGGDNCITRLNSGKDFLEEPQLTSYVPDRKTVHSSASTTNPSVNITPTTNQYGIDQSLLENLSPEYVCKGNEKMVIQETEEENIEDIDSRVEEHSILSDRIENSNENYDKVIGGLHTNTHVKTINSTTSFQVETHSERSISHLVEEISSAMATPYEEESCSCQEVNIVLIVDSLRKTDFSTEHNVIVQERDAFNQEKWQDASAEIHTAHLPTLQNANFDDIHRLKGEDNSNKDDQAYARDVVNATVLRNSQNPLPYWHSLDQPIDPSLFSRVESLPSSQYDVLNGDVGTSCKNQLLFDCINETLLQIYERSLKKRSSIASNMAESLDPPLMPKMDSIFEEVWAEIGWHSPSHLDQSVEYLVERDLIKDESWMNVQAETKLVASDLEAHILDDLLDEILRMS